MKHGIYYVSPGKIVPIATLSPSAPAQPSTAIDSGRVFRLGEVTVPGRRNLDSAGPALTRRIEVFNRLDAGRKLSRRRPWPLRQFIVDQLIEPFPHDLFPFATPFC